MVAVSLPGSQWIISNIEFSSITYFLLFSPTNKKLIRGLNLVTD